MTYQYDRMAVEYPLGYMVCFRCRGLRYLFPRLPDGTLDLVLCDCEPGGFVTIQKRKEQEDGAITG